MEYFKIPVMSCDDLSYSQNVSSVVSGKSILTKCPMDLKPMLWKNTTLPITCKCIMKKTYDVNFLWLSISRKIQCLLSLKLVSLILDGYFCNSKNSVKKE